MAGIKTAVQELKPDINKLSPNGVLITLGMVFGVLGTSPLYTMKAIVSNSGSINEVLIYGVLSCIFWTLTLSTTIKYVLITLKVDNNGEGGIFALFTLLKKKPLWTVFLTMIIGSAFLSDCVIAPSITVTSSVEGFRISNSEFPVLPVVLLIIAVIFFIQQFGTSLTGSSFGLIMMVWFIVIGIFGFIQIQIQPEILRAVNPEYAYHFIKEYPGGFLLLSAIFLCTTGAGMLYTNIGIFGKSNIRLAWLLVKITLLLSYFGQAAWLLKRPDSQSVLNPFFGIIPEWFIAPAIAISIAASIVASQAVIKGSFTLLSEAVSLNFWPKVRVLHPTMVRSQVYMPVVNWVFWIACALFTFIFRESDRMYTAYSLAIIITEFMITFMLSYYFLQKGINHRLVLLFFMIYVTLEGSFLFSNLHNFLSGGWATILLSLLYFVIMLGWYFGRRLKNRYVTFTNLSGYLEMFRDLSKDTSVPKIATNLVYIMRANRKDQVESKVIYSIFNKQPKRADTYWFLHVDRVDEPDRFEYEVTQIIPGILIRVDFILGFKVEPKINLYFREVLEDMVDKGQIKLESSFKSLQKHCLPADFMFVLIDRILTRDYKLTNLENLTLALHSISRLFCISDVKALELDSTNTIEEQVPITLDKPVKYRIKRIR